MNSPFMFKPGRAFEEEPEKVIRMSDINQLTKNHTIDEIDLKVLTMIHEMRFTTAAIINQYFQDEVMFSPTFGKKRMRKFIKYGLVRRFYITFEGEDMLHRRTVNFYSLSSASISYLKKYKKLKSYSIEAGDIANVGDILGKLSINQLKVNFARRYTSASFVNNEMFPRRIKVIHPNITYSIYSIRGDQHLDKLIDFLNDSSNENILLLTESELQAVKIWKEIHLRVTDSQLKFITDIMMTTDDMVDSVLEIIDTENGESIIEKKLAI